MFEINTPQSVPTAASWAQCSTPRTQDATYIRHLLMGDSDSPGASPSAQNSNEQLEEDLANTLSYEILLILVSA